jgi:hypothetical protein
MILQKFLFLSDVAKTILISWRILVIFFPFMQVKKKRTGLAVLLPEKMKA